MRVQVAGGIGSGAAVGWLLGLLGLFVEIKSRSSLAADFADDADYKKRKRKADTGEPGGRSLIRGNVVAERRRACLTRRREGTKEKRNMAERAYVIEIIQASLGGKPPLVHYLVNGSVR